MYIEMKLFQIIPEQVQEFIDTWHQCDCKELYVGPLQFEDFNTVL